MEKSLLDRFQNPVNCYAAIKNYMNAIDEDFFDQQGHNYNILRFIRYMVKHNEMTEKFAAYFLLQGTNEWLDYPEFVNLATELENEAKELFDLQAENERFDLIQDKIYQIFADYVSEVPKGFVKFGMTVGWQSFDDDLQNYEEEYNKLNNLNLMELIKCNLLLCLEVLVKLLPPVVRL